MTTINKWFSITLLTLLSLTMFSNFVPAFAAKGDLLPSNEIICGSKSGGDSCAITGGADTVIAGGQEGVAAFIIQIARVVTYIAGALAVLYLVYGGVRYLTAQDDGATKSARGIIQNAIIGLVIVIVAYSIISIVSGLLSGQFLQG
jgi:Type IV secretion system pilin